MLWWSSQSKIMQFVYHIGKTKSGQNGPQRTQKGNLELDWTWKTGVDGKKWWYEKFGVRASDIRDGRERRGRLRGE
jgi:hypothetical protein